MTVAQPLVLLVEDDENLCGVVRRFLQSRGYEMETADSAEAASDLLKGGLRPDLVLLDLNLPGDTGWDLLRGDAIASAGTPPVVITSATTVSPKRLTEFGVAGYLPKPFPLETLVAIVERSIAPEAEEPAHE
jgi:DNA-binding response OmpR family regulator